MLCMDVPMNKYEYEYGYWQKKTLRNGTNFGSREPVPSFLKTSSDACGYLIMIACKRPTLAIWIREKRYEYDTLYCTLQRNAPVKVC